MTLKLLPVLVVSLSLTLPMASPRAQPCGPLTVQIADTGPGCAPSGASIPNLSAFVSASTTLCSVSVALDQKMVVFPIRGATLLIGVSDPGLAIPFLPGCALRAMPDVSVAMVPDVVFGRQHFAFSFPQDPALIGSSLFAQGIWSAAGELRFSNGIQLSVR